MYHVIINALAIQRRISGASYALKKGGKKEKERKKKKKKRY